MLDIKKIQQSPDWYKQKLATRNIDPKSIDELLALDVNRREYIKKIDELRSKRKMLEDKFVNSQNNSEILNVLKKVKAALEDLEANLAAVEADLTLKMKILPNVPLEDVPSGAQDKVIKEWGKKPKFNFVPKDYLEIAQNLDLIDVEAAAKVVGSRFGFLKNELVLLQFALINYVFNTFGNKYNFVPVLPPFFIKPKYFEALGYIDTKEGKEETYYLPQDDLYLIGTAEHIIAAMNGDQTFDEKELPKRFLAFSSCFRREAGSYGKDTKGILRVHQFDKIEMFSICTPEQSQKEQELITSIEEEIMQNLMIPYRIVQTSTLNLSRPSARSFDLESWLPGQNNGLGEYRETHSNSNCTDFQARRLNIKYKKISDGKQLNLNQFCYTLNGTALALGRAIIAIIENYQQKDGSIKIPKILVPYMKNVKVIPTRRLILNKSK